MMRSRQVYRSWFSLLSGRNVPLPRRMLPLMNHGEYADGTDRLTDTRPLHYAFRYGRGQRNPPKLCSALCYWP